MGLKNRNITGILGFDVARAVSNPNASIPVHSITAVGPETHIDIALCPKNYGALTVRVADSSNYGDKRGEMAIDLQSARSNSGQVASGARSGILSGMSNKANGYAAVVDGGSTNSANGMYSAIAGGYGNTASGMYSFVAGGAANTADGGYGLVIGGSRGNAYLSGQSVVGCLGDVANKVRQDSKITMLKYTSDNIASEMYIVPSGYTRAVLKNKCAWAFDITILAHSSTNVLHTARFKRSGLILRGATAATTTLEGAVQTIGTDIINSNLTGCAVTISADTTNGSLKVEVTGIASTTIIWQAKIELVEIEI